MPISGEWSRNEGMDPDVQAFMNCLQLPDPSILETFVLTHNGRRLTEKEAKTFIAHIRTELKLI